MKGSPRFWQDEDGVWWCPAGVGNSNPPRPGRTRCKIKTCEHCGEDYLVSPHVAQRSRYCDRACAGAARKGKGLTGPGASRWKGGKIKRNGYVLCWAPEHHSINPATKRQYVFEHRLVMEEHLGRHLMPNESVHHINGVRDDNRVENLELWVKPQLAGQRVDDLVAFVVENYPEYVKAAFDGRAQLQLAA